MYFKYSNSDNVSMYLEFQEQTYNSACVCVVQKVPRLAESPCTQQNRTSSKICGTQKEILCI